MMNLLKYGTQVVFFDKDRGAEIAIRAAGESTALERGLPTARIHSNLNQLPRPVYSGLIWLPVQKKKDEEHSTRELTEITQAVNAVAESPVDMRGFELVIQKPPPGDGNGIADRLRKWTQG